MTYEEINSILKEFGLPYAYNEFNGPVTYSQYVAYFEDDKNLFYADNIVYDQTPHFAIELYTKTKDRKLEQKLIDIFQSHEVAWSGGVSTYIDNEQIYQTVFYC